MRVVAEVDVEARAHARRVDRDGAGRRQGVNPQAVDGPDRGRHGQGLGLALMEEIQTRDGLITNASFTDYLIPTTLDMPPVVSELVEDPDPTRPTA
jgi:CO/xanthine dehydrogenase Mo-binding subunit